MKGKAVLCHAKENGWLQNDIDGRKIVPVVDEVDSTTCKEFYEKLVGKGLSKSFNSLECLIIRPDLARLLH